MTILYYLYLQVSKAYIVLTVFLTWLRQLTECHPTPLFIRNCRGRKLQVHHPKETLENIVTNHIVVEDYSNGFSASEIMTSVRPSRQCPFTYDFSDLDDQRLPRLLPKAVCPLNKCSRRCKPIVLKKTVLTKKCHSQIGVIYKMSLVDVTVGFIKQHSFVKF